MQRVYVEDLPAPIELTRPWLVEFPLDGTSNYARQFPFFCVSIGLCVNGRPQLGVIFDPLRGDPEFVTLTSIIV